MNQISNHYVRYICLKKNKKEKQTNKPTKTLLKQSLQILENSCTKQTDICIIKGVGNVIKQNKKQHWRDWYTGNLSLLYHLWSVHRAIYSDTEFKAQDKRRSVHFTDVHRALEELIPPSTRNLPWILHMAWDRENINNYIQSCTPTCFITLLLVQCLQHFGRVANWVLEKSVLKQGTPWGRWKPPPRFEASISAGAARFPNWPQHQHKCLLHKWSRSFCSSFSPNLSLPILHSKSSIHPLRF